MSRPAGPSATFGEYTINIVLPESIGLDAFRATKHDYVRQLRARTSLPQGLRRLLDQLFERGAIESCGITFGRRVVLRIPREYRGQALMQSQALRHFEKHFAAITGERISATWEAASNGSIGRSSHSVDSSSAFLHALAVVVDVTAEGLQIAAAIKILTDD